MTKSPHISLTCSGCRKQLPTRSGFWSHLLQSKKPECQAALAELERIRDESSECGSDVDSDATTDSFSNLSDMHEMDMPSDNRAQAGTATIFDILARPASRDEEQLVEDDDRALNLDLERTWEPHRPQATAEVEANADEQPILDELSAEAMIEGYRRAVLNADQNPRIVRYSSHHKQSHPGGVIARQPPRDATDQAHVNGGTNVWAPFASEVDWKVAKWAKLRGSGSTAFSELLGIDGLHDALGLSYKNSAELNLIIDTQLPKRPEWRRHEVIIANESFELYSRDILDCIRALWSDPEFVPHLILEPERHYADDDHKIRMYHDMHTGKWWWSTQKAVEKKTQKKNVTIVPVIISSDKTQLTTFRNKTAYPLYMTIGNIPKHIRRKPSRQAQILVGYLPTSNLKHITNKAARRRAMANMFHGCVRFILKPLETVGLSGVHLASGDGLVRDCHPIVAADVSDYPEQCLATCTKSGECPTCPVHRDNIGDPEKVEPPRDLQPILDALEELSYNTPQAFTRACKAVGIKPVQHPFWEHLPFLNIFRSITPDLLHQLYQGNIKHLIGWLQKACGEDEIDARCRRLPPNHNIRLFLKGISHLSRVTGTEHDQMCRFLLPLISGTKLPGNKSSAQLVRATKGMLDFLYLAKYPVHTTETLDQLDHALDLYHNNRQIFIDLGIRVDFNFPKGHFINHYRELIEYFGTTDNFNTEYSERLHIDFAKDAYRSTNKKDEYLQMTTWLDRQERIRQHDKFIARQLLRLEKKPPIPDALPPKLPPLVYPRRLKMAAQPTTYGVPIPTIVSDYHARDFVLACARFSIHLRDPSLSKGVVDLQSRTLHIPFQKISVFRRIKFTTRDPHSENPLEDIVIDSIHCDPEYTDKCGRVIPGRFDTVLVNLQNGGSVGVKGYRVARIRCIFSLPASAMKLWFTNFGIPPDRVPPHLAYVDWFTPFPSRPAANNGLYKVSRQVINGIQQSAIIPVTSIRQSVHLVPVFGSVAPQEWKSSNVLDLAFEFYLNPFSDRYSYCTLI